MAINRRIPRGIETKNLKLGQRLIGLFMCMALIVAITGGFGAWSIKRVGDRIQGVLTNLANQQKQVMFMELAQKDCHINLLNAAMVRTDSEKFEEYAEDYRMKRDLFRSKGEMILKGNAKMGIKPALPGSVIEAKAKAALANWAKFEADAEDLLAVKGNLLKGAGPGAALGQTMTDDRLLELTEANEMTKTVVDDLLVEVSTQMTLANKEVTTIQRSAFAAFVAVVIAAILLAALFGILTTRYIVRRIAKMATALDRGAEGDLAARVEIDSGDELGTLADDFNKMLGKLAEMMGNINRSTGELGQVTDNLAEASKQVVNGAKLQADGISNTSSAMTQINASIKGVAQGVDGLSLSATESSSSILEMAASVEEVAQNVENLAMSVDEVSSSITEMAASIRQVGNSVGSLMDTASTTASSVLEMDSSIRQVETNVMETAAISEEVRKDAEMGKMAVEATIAGINEIKRSSGITYEVINTLSGRASDIGAILSVIDEVAEQTNLLALNAAIIAAQAGEHGKGFAVVADEIKELAERTSSSTREIAEVIRGVQDETQRAVEAINQAEKSIAEGEMLSQRSGEALNKIVGGVKRSTDRMGEIARATVEQARGSVMIRDAMEKVSEMVAQIAKATHEQGQGGELITTAAQRMKDITIQVRASTREQSKVGNFIAKSTEDITGMIQKIKLACDEQSRGSEQIVVAVEDIQRSTNINLEAIDILNEALASLLRQTEILKREMGVFKV
ncbi:MAG: methyl-accepting chemotaxis protein [Geobacteraceae bacterium]|nr:methyl-accepting chemotaxis protein [Geobacteraceae bacterium]